MDNSNVDIGLRIRKMRKRRHLNQEELGNIIGLSRKQVSKIERGVTGVSIDNEIRLSSIFNCSIDYIIKGSEFESVDSHIPKGIIDILLSDDIQEKELLKKYLDFYQQLRKKT